MTNNVSAGETSVLSKELRLPNGITLSNRLAQSAMTEHLATGDGAPSWQLIEAYRRFAVSGAALIISGNVMVNGWSLEAPRNVVIEDERHMPQLRQWAATTSGTDARLILQLSLSGRQTQRGLALAGRRQDVATASAVPLTIGGPLFKPQGTHRPGDQADHRSVHLGCADRRRGRFRRRADTCRTRLSVEPVPVAAG
jgi:2,4-dienoyl-CoA reductase-like NADH-dependent reductase (Old Yellow Enzyme family)